MRLNIFHGVVIFGAMLCAMGFSQVAFGSEEPTGPIPAEQGETVSDAEVMPAVDMSAYDVDEQASISADAALFVTAAENLDVNQQGQTVSPDLASVDEDSISAEDDVILGEAMAVALDLNSLDSPSLVGTMSESTPPRP